MRAASGEDLTDFLDAGSILRRDEHAGSVDTIDKERFRGKFVHKTKQHTFHN